MKVSYNWLKEFVSFSNSPEQVAEILTKTGLEVEGIETVGSVQGGLIGVVTGEVLTCEKHPDADKLKVTTVNIGNSILQIVCGAPNVAAGQKVLVALAGTTIYPTGGEPLTLKQVKIRGVESNGMICAEDELGLGTSHDGILVLPETTAVGLPAAQALNIDTDSILEIGLTPNRCDAMGHLGVARDIRAYLAHHDSTPLALNFPKYTPIQSFQINDKQIASTNDTDCHAYFIGSISGVNVGPSPDWLVKRLTSIGGASINNVVDCANLVMHELGSPLHAFDASKFTKSLTVRSANEGESLVTLDGVSRTLTHKDLVIDGDGTAHCLAGVLGGKDSGVTNTTTDILIESAYFNPSSIRKTAKHHGIHSDASFRFERGVDPTLPRIALERVMTLICETSGGHVNGIHEVKTYTKEATSVALTVEMVNKQLGTQLTESALENILISLDFERKDKTHWLIPQYRGDVHRPIDVIEEVIRIAGFDAFPNPDKWKFSVPFNNGVSSESVRNQISQRLAANGFHEVMNNSLTKAAYGELTASKQDGKPVFLKNPLSRDLSMLRTSMLFGMLETLSYNKNRQTNSLKIFEFGQTYHTFSSKHVEKQVLALAISGMLDPESWHGARKSSFYDLKGYINTLIEGLNAKQIEEIPTQEGGSFSEGIDIKVEGKVLVSLGKVSPQWTKSFDLKQEVFAAIVDWKRWIELSASRVNRFQELPKTFHSRRDFALLLDQHISYASLEKAAKKAASERLIATNLFDVYEGDKLEAGKKSYALSFLFRDNDHTLTDQEIDQDMEAIRVCFEREFGAQLR